MGRHLPWHRSAGSLFPALLLLLLPLGVAARPAGDTREPERQQGTAPQGVSLDQAISTAERRHKARVVRASTEVSDGRRVHVLRLLSDEGRVWTVRIDAATGQER